MDKQKGSLDTEAILYLCLVAWIVASWITHIIVCLKAGSFGFLIAGAIMIPIAVMHGTGCWFGVW